MSSFPAKCYLCQKSIKKCDNSLYAAELAQISKTRNNDTFKDFIDSCHKDCLFEKAKYLRLYHKFYLDIFGIDNY